MWVKWLLGLALIGHGIGHITGFMASWTKMDSGFTASPWIFSPNVTMTSAIGKIFGIIWLAAMLFLAAAGVGLLTGQTWWVNTALTGAVISILAVIPWWNTVVPGAKAGFLFDLLLLVFLLTPLKDWLLNLMKP